MFKTCFDLCIYVTCKRLTRLITNMSASNTNIYLDRICKLSTSSLISGHQFFYDDIRIYIQSSEKLLRNSVLPVFYAPDTNYANFWQKISAESFGKISQTLGNFFASVSRSQLLWLSFKKVTNWCSTVHVSSTIIKQHTYVKSNLKTRILD